MSERYPPQPGIRPVMVGALALGMALIAVSYAFIPTAPIPVGRVSIVQQIENLGPIWPVTFGLLATGLVGCLVLHRGYTIVLSAAGALFLAFSTALFIGALASSPIAPIVGASLSLVTTIACWVTASAYGRSR